MIKSNFVEHENSASAIPGTIVLVISLLLLLALSLQRRGTQATQDVGG
ncbi:hypothetical protein ACMG4P_25970 [Pseudovibrio denitrificans]